VSPAPPGVSAALKISALLECPRRGRRARKAARQHPPGGGRAFVGALRACGRSRAPALAIAAAREVGAKHVVGHAQKLDLMLAAKISAVYAEPLVLIREADRQADLRGCDGESDISGRPTEFGRPPGPGPENGERPVEQGIEDRTADAHQKRASARPLLAIVLQPCVECLDAIGRTGGGGSSNLLTVRLHGTRRER